MDAIKRLDRSVKGRAVLVTGAASGMGRATAHVFANEGALVAVTDINEAGVARVVEEIKAEGGTAQGWRLDVMDRGVIKRVVAEVAERFGRLDILINNAGFGGFHPLDGDEYDRIWDRTHRGTADRATAHRARGAAASAKVRRGENRQHRFDRRPRRHAGRQSVRGREDRSDRTHARVGGGSGAGRNHGELYLPGTDPHGSDRCDSGGAQNDFWQTPDRAEAIWLSGGGRAHHVQPVSSGGFLHHRCARFPSTED